MLIVTLLVAAVIFGVVVIYNRIIGKYNAVDRAWASVLTQERQKNNIIPSIEQLVEEYKLHESEVLTQITALRSALADMGAGIDTDKLTATEQTTNALLQGLKVTVEAYPDLKASTVYCNLMTEISEQQQQIGAAIRIFNSNVEEFNNAIQMFPGSLINASLIQKQKIHSFSDTQAQQGFEYRPHL
ncbi:LemA family protein [Shewanella sp. NIFS-20-20]|uniref:LemA family protein n=1 Tax=Shewanella sp. NIFS-20-20 TaxID=2853806 RepID=UPI001C44B9DF|nr:LemA family protein [Shewanella sp. NIFS-20-20]MBV7317479.1 LemA family protein [Shewanella sp. NIFS-20-20]